MRLACCFFVFSFSFCFCFSAVFCLSVLQSLSSPLLSDSFAAEESLLFQLLELNSRIEIKIKAAELHATRRSVCGTFQSFSHCHRNKKKVKQSYIIIIITITPRTPVDWWLPHTKVATSSGWGCSVESFPHPFPFPKQVHYLLTQRHKATNHQSVAPSTDICTERKECCILNIIFLLKRLSFWLSLDLKLRRIGGKNQFLIKYLYLLLIFLCACQPGR